MSEIKLSFEEAFNALEEITEKLGSKDIPLDKAIELYEQGMKLSAFCSEKLESAKQKIETLRGGEAK